MQIKCGKSLKYSKWNPEMPNLHGNDFIAYVDHTKNIMFKQRIYLNYLSKFKRFPLEHTNLHRRWLDLWRLNIATVSKPFQIFTTALWGQFMAPCQISTFSDLFSIFVIFRNKKIHFYVVPNNVFAYCLAYFSNIWHPHVEKNVREIFITIFVQ